MAAVSASCSLTLLGLLFDHFNVKTGAVCALPARKGVKSFAVRIVGTDVEVEIE